MDGKVEKPWFGAVLREIMQETKITVCQLAEKSGVSEHTVRLSLMGRQEPPIGIAEKIIMAMGYEFEVVKAAEAVQRSIVESTKAQEDSYCWNCGSENSLVMTTRVTTRCTKCGATADA